MAAEKLVDYTGGKLLSKQSRPNRLQQTKKSLSVNYSTNKVKFLKWGYKTYPCGILDGFKPKKIKDENIPAMSRFNNGPCIVIYDCLRLRYFQISELNESSGCHLSDRFVFYGNPSIIKSDWQMKDIFKSNNLSYMCIQINKQQKTHLRVFSFSIEFPFKHITDY